jgi:membrane associated rhomboid family serine protease
MITYTFLVIIVVFSLYCFNKKEAMYKYMFHPYSIHHHREHYRFLTHAFIHGDYIHLAFNCIALYGFGLELENVLLPDLFGEKVLIRGEILLIPNHKVGELLYLILFTGGIYAASFTEYFLHKNNKSYSSLGASGAISSVMFCWIMLSPLGTIGFFLIPMKGWVAGIVLLGVSYFLIRRKKTGKHNDNISHESHFWGALFGIVFILVAKPEVAKEFIHQVFGKF